MEDYLVLLRDMAVNYDMPFRQVCPHHHITEQLIKMTRREENYFNFFFETVPRVKFI